MWIQAFLVFFSATVFFSSPVPANDCALSLLKENSLSELQNEAFRLRHKGSHEAAGKIEDEIISRLRGKIGPKFGMGDGEGLSPDFVFINSTDKAAIKPFFRKGHFYEQPLHEEGAFRLSQLINAFVVPVTIVRFAPEEGSIQPFIDGINRCWMSPKVSKCAISEENEIAVDLFRLIIGDSDSDLFQFNDGEPVLVDFEGIFSKGDYARKRNAFDPKLHPVRLRTHRVISKLKTLKYSDLNSLEPFFSKEQLEFIWKKILEILVWVGPE